MKVMDVYMRDPVKCGPDSNLAAAARAMWEFDCGIVPVIDAGGLLMGVVSDRDITMAALTKNRPPSEIHVREVMTGAVRTCRPEDDIAEAMKTLAAHRLRRLPVVDGEGRLLGMLSLSDLVHRGQIPGTGPDEIPGQELLAMLKEVLNPRRETRRQTRPEALRRSGD